MVGPHGRARIDSRRPEALAVCDRCGFLYNHSDLQWQYQWTGTRLQNLMRLVCQDCLDIPQEQIRSIILPPDPLPILNPRSEQYTAEVISYMYTATNKVMTQMNGTVMIREIRITPNPEAPGTGYLDP